MEDFCAHYTYLRRRDVQDRKSVLIDRQLESLAEIELNGRQIKNIVKTARLSRQERIPLGTEHVEMVLKDKRGGFL